MVGFGELCGCLPLSNSLYEIGFGKCFIEERRLAFGNSLKSSHSPIGPAPVMQRETSLSNLELRIEESGQTFAVLALHNTNRSRVARALNEPNLFLAGQGRIYILGVCA